MHKRGNSLCFCASSLELSRGFTKKLFFVPSDRWLSAATDGGWQSSDEAYTPGKMLRYLAETQPISYWKSDRSDGLTLLAREAERVISYDFQGRAIRRLLMPSNFVWELLQCAVCWKNIGPWTFLIAQRSNPEQCVSSQRAIEHCILNTVG